jgi:predicted AAA+ superfamily ATPase
MTKTEIIATLNDWNFWNSRLKTGVPRPAYVNQLSAAIKTRQVVVITGPRRAGKSYVMRQMIQHLIAQGLPAQNSLMVNFEDPRWGTLTTQSLQQIYDTYLEYQNPSDMPYIFLDEIQEVADWEKWVRSFHELDKAHLIISGSNAKLLSHELSTLLTGRHLDMTVFPLSFHEFLSFKSTSAENKIECSRMFREFLDYGGFPEVTLSEEKKQILLQYYDDVVNKDLIRRFKIRKSEQMKSLSRYFLSNAATSMTYNSCAKFLNLSVDTVQKFSGYLQDAYLFFLLPRYSHKFKEQEKSPRKLYCIDSGLSNVVGFNSSPNIGRVLEQTVFLELKRRSLTMQACQIFYWKDVAHREVDFVVKVGKKITQLIQVCADLSDPKTKNREFHALTKAMDDLKCSTATVITLDQESSDEIDGKTIRCAPIQSWLFESRDNFPTGDIETMLAEIERGRFTE